MTQAVTQEPAVEAPLSKISRLDGFLATLRMAFSFPVMLMAWIVLIVLRLAERNLPDPDIWWHLRNAQYLFLHHALPNFDTYSFTVAGHPRINFEWLGEVPYYLAWRAFGLEGIETLMLVVLEAIFLGVLYLSYKRTGHIKASILACWVAVALGTVNFGPRTILFGYLYLVILLVILERFRSTGRGPLWPLPFLFCLWINTHGSWPLGMIVLGAFTVCGLVEVEWGRVRATRWSAHQKHQLFAVLGASCAALFLNPYGYRLVLYPLDVALRQRLGVGLVSEWAPVDFTGPRGKVVLLVLAGLFLSALGARSRWILSDLVLTLVAFYAGLSHERFLFFAGIIVAPVVAELLEAVPRYRPEIDKPLLNALIILGVGAFVAFRFPGPTQLQKQVSKKFPSEIVPYLESHKLQGRVLNCYDWGGYLGWEDAQLKLFIDGRADIFEYAGVFKDYLRLTSLQDPIRVLDEYRIRYVLFPPDAPPAVLLRSNAGWKVDFTSSTSTLIERIGTLPAGPPKDARMRKASEAW